MAPLTPTKRARVCMLRDLDDETFESIGSLMGIDQSTASRTYRKYGQKYNFYDEPKRTGRPKKFTAADRRKAVKMIDSGAATDATDLQRRAFPDVTPRTVRGALIKAGLPGRRRA